MVNKTELLATEQQLQDTINNTKASLSDGSIKNLVASKTIKIGDTTLSEANLIALLALLKN